MPKEVPVREIGKTTLALLSLAVCIIIFIFVGWPLSNWLLDLARQSGWVNETVGGGMVSMLIFTVAFVPTAVAYALLENWCQKLVGEDDDT